jgi:hypothetical protein
LKFQKGQSGNPAGRPRLPEDVRKAMAADQTEFYRSLSKVIRMNRMDLTALTKDPDASVMDLMVASLAARAVKEGDPQRIRLLAERIAGKVPEKIELEGEVSTPGATQISHALVFQTIQALNRKESQ